MKGIVLSLAFLSVALSDRLDNRYLPPPNNALIGKGDYNPYPASAPIVEDARSAKPSSLLIGQASQPTGQYSAPTTKNSAVSSRQYLFPANQYSGSTSRRQEPSGQASASSNQYSKPNGQFGSSSQYGQASSTNGQFGGAHQYSGPSSNLAGSNGQYSNPNGLWSNGFQQSGPIQPSSSINQYSKANGQFPSTFQASNGHHSGAFQSAEPSGQSSIPVNQYSQPSGQASKPNGQFGAYSSQYPKNQYYNNGSPIGIVRSSIIPNAGDGSYSYNYETENGIMAQEEGSLVNDAENARGGYSYTSPEGERIVVEYTADEDGFKPTGSHIPQIPEAILKSIELNKAALARGEYQEGQYDEQSFARSGQYGNNPKFASPSYNSKYASPHLDNGAPQVASSVRSDSFAAGQQTKSTFGQNGYQYNTPNGFQQGNSNGVSQFGGFSSLQQQKSAPVVPQLSFAASEAAKVQFEGPQQAYGVPSFRSGTVQDAKGGYKY